MITTVSQTIVEILDEYIASKSEFYHIEIQPYLPELAQHLITELAKRNIKIEQEQP